MAIILLCISSYQDWKLCTPFGLDEQPNNLSNKIHNEMTIVWTEYTNLGEVFDPYIYLPILG